MWAKMQVRSKVRASGGVLVDVAGGHGLLAVLFAVFETRRFDRFVVADTRQPDSFSKVRRIESNRIE